jgi:hypothetical protein
MNDIQYQTLASTLEASGNFDSVTPNVKPSDGAGFAEITCVYKHADGLTLVMRICYLDNAWVGNIDGHGFYAFAYKTVSDIVGQIETFDEYYFG